MYSVEYVNCKICGSDAPKFLGIRGSQEHAGAVNSEKFQEHMVTNVVRCRKCGFVYTNPLIMAKLDTYNNPDTYLPSSKTSPEVLFSFTLNLIERYIKRGRILDVGCGKGEFLNIAKKKGWEAYGLEPSANFAEFALRRYGLDVKCASLEKAQYPDDFFDAVVLNMVLEHVDNPRMFISEINRVLKKNGLLFIEVPNMDSFMLKMATLYFRLSGRDWSPLLSPLHYPFHCYGYNPSSIKRLLYEQSFHIEKVVIRDSSLRGFRSDAGGTVFEKFIRAIFTKLGGLIGKGDVLIAIATKRQKETGSDGVRI